MSLVGNRLPFERAALRVRDGHVGGNAWQIALHTSRLSGGLDDTRRLVAKGLIIQESDQHQYRFLDIVDVDTNKPIFRIEHETRSMRHPMFNRTFINRNPDMSNRNFVPGYEVGLWALA